MEKESSPSILVTCEPYEIMLMLKITGIYGFNIQFTEKYLIVT